MDNRKVGRPKLADNNLKKKSLIISGICLIVVIALILTGIKILDITPKKLKGEATEYKTYEVGEEFCLDTECFYVIEDNGDTVTALAKYNLLVGHIYDIELGPGWSNVSRNDLIDQLTYGYALQSINAIAYNDENSIRTGTMAFSYKLDDNKNIGYWVEDSIGTPLKNEYGKEYPAWVFDTNSSLWEPVQNYKSYLRNLGYIDIDVTLPNYENIIKLGCSGEDNTCENAPAWVWSTSYWLGSASGSYYVWGVVSNGNFDYDNFYYLDSYYGLRPVITISKEDLIEKEVTTSEEITTTESTAKKIETKTKETTTSTTTKKIVRRKTIITEKEITTTSTQKEETTSKIEIAKIEGTTKSKKERKNKSYPIIGIILGILLIGFIVYKKNN